MVNLQLFIEGQEVELHDDENVTLTQTLQDVLDLQKVFTDFTRTFNVPASKTNNKLFKHFYNPAITNFDARVKKEAQLFINYKPFKGGRIKLESVQMQNNAPVNYRVTFFGNTIRIKEIFRDDTLQDLVTLDYQIAYTFANVKQYMQKGYDLTIAGEDFTDAVIYPLITHTDRLTYDSGTDIADSNNLHATSTSKGLRHDQLKPAIKIHALLLAIQKEYNVEFTTDFFNTTNKPYYDLYMWMHKQEGQFINIEDEATYRTFPTQWSNITGQDYSLITGFVSSDGTGYNNIGNYQGDRFMVLDVTTASEATYTLRISLNNTVIHESEHTHNGLKNVITFTDELLLQRTQTVGLTTSKSFYKVEIKTAASVEVTVRMTIVQKSVYGDPVQASAENTLPSNAGAYTTNVSTALPKMKIIDFLTGLFKMFNLVAYYTDEKIEVLPLEDWYNASTQTYDVTEYLDLSKSEVSNTFPYNNINFAYQDNETFLSYYHKDMFNKTWGALAYENTADYTSKEYKVEIPFSHMKFERLYDNTTTLATDVQWGWSVDSKRDPHLGKPLLFYAKRITSGTPINLIEETGSAQNSIINYYVPTNTVDGDTDTQSLHFGAELNEYTRASSQKSIFSTYYKSYIQEVFDPSRRLFNFSAYLPLSVLMNIQLNDKLIIFNELYKINKLVTDFGTNLTKLELINEVQDFTISNDSIIADIVTSTDSELATADTTLITADSEEYLW